MRIARRGGVLAAIGLGVLVAMTVVLFTVPLPAGPALALQVAWFALLVALCWGTARLMRHRQRASLSRVKADGAAESHGPDGFDRATLTGQDQQLPPPPAR